VSAAALLRVPDPDSAIDDVEVPAKVKADRSVVRAYLADLFGSCEGFIAVSRRAGTGWVTETYDVNDTTGPQTRPRSTRISVSTFYSQLTTLRRRPGPGKRGVGADSLELTCLSLDIDCAFGTHKGAKTLPTTIEEALSVRTTARPIARNWMLPTDPYTWAWSQVKQ